MRLKTSDKLSVDIDHVYCTYMYGYFITIIGRIYYFVNLISQFVKKIEKILNKQLHTWVFGDKHFVDILFH